MLRWSWWSWWRVRGRSARNAGSSHDRARALSAGSRAASRHVRARSAPLGQARGALSARTHPPRIENEDLGKLVCRLQRDAVGAQEVTQEPPFERKLATRHHLNEPLRSHPSRIPYRRRVPRATCAIDGAAAFAWPGDATLRQATWINTPRATRPRVRIQHLAPRARASPHGSVLCSTAFRACKGGVRRVRCSQSPFGTGRAARAMTDRGDGCFTGVFP